MRIGIALAGGAFASGVASLLDVLSTAEQLRRTVDRAIEPFVICTLGTAPEVSSSCGMTLVPDLQASDPQALQDIDLLVIPGLGSATPSALAGTLREPAVRQLSRLVASTPAEVKLAAACTGTFVLAQAGVLDGHHVTTSWWLAGAFARRFPDVRLDMSRMVVHSGRLTTAGAAFAHIDLALSIVSRASARLADEVARYLLIEPRTSVSLETSTAHLAAADLLVADFEAWVRAHLAEDVTIDDAARAVATTRRTLERRCRARTGLTPHQFVNRIRGEHARHLRRTTTLSFDQIAPLLGLGRGASVRNLLRRAEIASAH